MRVLIISNILPYPPHDGTRLTLFNYLRHLSKNHDIDLLAFIDNPEHPEYEEKIKPYCKNLYTVLARSNHSVLQKIGYHLSLKPYMVVKRYSKLFNDEVKNRIQKKLYDVIHFDGFVVFPYGLQVKSVPRIAFALDAVSLYFKRNINYEKIIWKKISYLIEYMKMRLYEQAVYPHYEKCIVVSETDRKVLEKSNIKNTCVIPNGIDINHFIPTPNEEEFPSLLFTGNMDFPPNVHAAIWLTKKILPEIREIFPEVKLYIVGRNPSAEINSLKEKNSVIVTGFVEDIRIYFNKASVFVCPMVSGTGVKTKMLEAMAMGKAIVATSLSIQGIPGVKDGDHLMIADKPPQFSEKVIGLLKNKNQRIRLALKARNLVKDNYSWKKSAELLETIYRESIHEFSAKNKS